MKKYVLKINNLSLQVKIGLPEQERQNFQEISINLQVIWENCQKNFQQDSLEESICYDKICQEIKHFCENKSFKTIEFLTNALYILLKKNLPSQAKLSIEVTKTNPPIAGLKGGASFSIED